MINGSLLLYPTPAETAVPLPTVIERLRRIGFLGEPAPAGAFLAGERFLQWVTFMGCAPYLRLAPTHPGDVEYCHIRILGPWDRVHFCSGPNTRAPGCPHCRRRVADWHILLSAITADPTLERPCPHCGAASKAQDWNWRHQAGFGRLFAQITPVFPGEAVPVDDLLQAIAEPRSAPWRYFFLQHRSAPAAGPFLGGQLNAPRQ